MIWFLEGQSSQREVIMGARAALPDSLRIVASHRQLRGEITGQADLALQEPEDDAERIDWVIDNARQLGVRVLVAGRIGAFYEHHRQRFIDAGLDLVTGGLAVETFDRVDDKSRFTAAAEQAGLACVPAITVTDADQLQQAYATLSAQRPV